MIRPRTKIDIGPISDFMKDSIKNRFPTSVMMDLENENIARPNEYGHLMFMVKEDLIKLPTDEQRKEWNDFAMKYTGGRYYAFTDDIRKMKIVDNQLFGLSVDIYEKYGNYANYDESNKTSCSMTVIFPYMESYSLRERFLNKMKRNAHDNVHFGSIGGLVRNYSMLDTAYFNMFFAPHEEVLENIFESVSNDEHHQNYAMSGPERCVQEIKKKDIEKIYGKKLKELEGVYTPQSDTDLLTFHWLGTDSLLIKTI